ncbi:MAG: transposase [Ardenticatenaceae bacterium]|nr:transposase [Ardenticatenaceae bacterium]
MRYDLRTEIEGMISLGVRVYDLRETHSIGLAKTHLQHVFTAAVINIVRLTAYLRGRIHVKLRLWLSGCACLAVDFANKAHYLSQAKPSDGSHRPRSLGMMAARVQEIIDRKRVLWVPKGAGCFVAMT